MSVGEVDGDMDGSFDGRVEGFDVGTPDEAIVGIEVEGTIVGSAVGFKLGEFVDAATGIADGVVLGLLVGPDDCSIRSPKRTHVASDGVSPFNR